MHPPDLRQQYDKKSSVAYSSLGSCHSWLPEHLGSAAPYFSYNKEDEDYSDTGSLDMDYSPAVTAAFSLDG
jgi:hypothetical protein